MKTTDEDERQPIVLPATDAGLRFLELVWALAEKYGIGGEAAGRPPQTPPDAGTKLQE